MLVRTKADSLDPRVRKALQLVDAEYGKRLRLSHAAETVHLSPSRFGHLFKQQTGVAFLAAVRNRRLAEALSLLRNPGLSIKEIAGRVGYNYLPNFMRDFKNRYGTSPSELRRSQGSQSD